MCMTLYTKNILTCTRPCLNQSGAGFWLRFRFCIGNHKVLATSAPGSSSLLGRMCGKGFGGPGGTPEHTELGGPSSSPPRARTLPAGLQGPTCSHPPSCGRPPLPLLKPILLLPFIQPFVYPLYIRFYIRYISVTRFTNDSWNCVLFKQYIFFSFRSANHGIIGKTC